MSFLSLSIISTAEATEGPIPPDSSMRHEISIELKHPTAAQLQADEEKEYKRNKIMQTTGYSMLGTSAVLIITGAAMVEGSPYGPVSTAGMILLGVGLGHFIVSAFLLGFSKTVIEQPLLPPTPLKIVPKSSLSISLDGIIYFFG